LRDLAASLPAKLANRVRLSVLLVALLVAGPVCQAPNASAIQIDIGTQYTPQQRHAAAEMDYALGVAENMYENPPVCMRMRPSGQIVAEVLGAGQLKRVRRALRELHIKATTRVTTIAAYNARVRRLAQTLRASKPGRFKDVQVGYRQIETVSASSDDLDFEPQCPPVSVTRPTLHSKAGLFAEEDTWSSALERRYGSDLVESSCCDAPRKGLIKVRPDAATASSRVGTETRPAVAAGCGPSQALTTKLSSTIRVYRLPSHSRIAPYRAYACWRHGGRASLALGYDGSYGFNAAHTTLIKLAPGTGEQPSSVIAWVQRIEGHSNSMSLRSGDVRTDRLIHETAPPGSGDTLNVLERGFFIVTPTGSLAWFGKGGPVDGDGRHTGPEGVWTFDADGEHLLAAGEFISKPLRWSAGTLYWTLEGPVLRATPLL
jgi:hypothetical protein